RRRLFLDEADLRDRLGALEAVLPRHHEAQRRAVLVGQLIAVQTDGHDRERVEGFVDAQAFDVWPRQERSEAPLLGGHFVGTQDRHELHELRAARRLETLEEIAERKADPRHDDRPPLDAAMAIDALLERMRLEDIFQRVRAWPAARAFDRDRPRLRLELPGVPRGVALVG